jgi:hypothetical protein
MPRQFDAATIAAIQAAAPNVHNGTYTVSHPARGHFTVKLWTSTKGELAGKRILSLLTGPSNETDYTAVAFWDDANKRVNVWRRFRGDPLDGQAPIDGYHWATGWSAFERKLSIWCDLAVRGEKGNAYSEGCRLQRESRCCVCNRKLTVPESIDAGIGPECASRR